MPIPWKLLFGQVQWTWGHRQGTPTDKKTGRKDGGTHGQTRGWSGLRQGRPVSNARPTSISKSVKYLRAVVVTVAMLMSVALLRIVPMLVAVGGFMVEFVHFSVLTYARRIARITWLCTAQGMPASQWGLVPRCCRGLQFARTCKKCTPYTGSLHIISFQADSGGLDCSSNEINPGILETQHLDQHPGSALSRIKMIQILSLGGSLLTRFSLNALRTSMKFSE